MSPEELNADLARKLEELQTLIARAQRERESLEAAIAMAKRLQTPVPRSTLALLESLADPAALADADRLAALAEMFASDSPTNLFERDRQALAIASLAEQGRSPAEIGRQLGLPQGEVELRLSARS